MTGAIGELTREVIWERGGIPEPQPTGRRRKRVPVKIIGA